MNKVQQFRVVRTGHVWDATTTEDFAGPPMSREWAMAEFDTAVSTGAYGGSTGNRIRVVSDDECRRLFPSMCCGVGWYRGGPR